VVLITTLTRRPPAQAHVILLSRALPLASAPLVDDDSVRCPLELNVRDATQYWGRAACMPSPPTGVTKAANRSWCMGKVAYGLQADGRQRDLD
jgi:hypothetical protein